MTSPREVRSEQASEAGAPRVGGIRVVVNQSVEPIDFDAWAVRYLAAVLDADRATHQLPEAA